MLELVILGILFLSLLKQRPKAKCHLIEPVVSNLYCGKLNFKLNKRKGFFSCYL